MNKDEIIDKLRFDEAEPEYKWPFAYDIIYKGKKWGVCYMGNQGETLIKSVKRKFAMATPKVITEPMIDEEKRDEICEKLKIKLAERIEWEMLNPEKEKKVKKETEQILNEKE